MVFSIQPGGYTEKIFMHKGIVIAPYIFPTLVVTQEMLFYGPLFTHTAAVLSAPYLTQSAIRLSINVFLHHLVVLNILNKTSFGL